MLIYIIGTFYFDIILTIRKLNRVVKTTDALGQEETYTYDNEIRLTGKTVRNGNVFTNTYNTYSQPTGTTVAGKEDYITYSYSITGALKTESNGTHQTTNYSDAAERVIRQTDSGEYENGSPVASYTYDENGKRKTLTYGNGVSTNYDYHDANLVTSLTNNAGGNVISSYAYEYYLDGNQSKKTDHKGRISMMVLVGW